MRLLELLGNRGAVENARAASTELSRRRVEREEVEIFLARLGARTLDTAAGTAARHELG
jgi:hypothetical protein